MAIADTVRTALGIIGNVISLCLFLSPSTTFYKIWKWRSTRQFSGLPYMAALLNCMLWVFYGLPFVHPNSMLVVTINGTGFVLEVIYVTIFLIFCTRRERIKLLVILLVIVISFALIVVLTLNLVHSITKRSFVVGILCTIFNVCMYASPLSVMRRVILTKSVKYMPFYLSLCCLANGLIWTAYGSIHFDIFIVIPNGLGALLGAVQLLLYGIYYLRSDEEDNRDAGQVRGRKILRGIEDRPSYIRSCEDSLLF